VNGTWDLLDAGARRSSGKWGEEGAIMTLDFFSRLESLGIDTVLLGFLMTHPPPQIRLPIVQNAAQQWRAKWRARTGSAVPVPVVTESERTEARRRRRSRKSPPAGATSAPRA